jgi:hypothetical protein
LAQLIDYLADKLRSARLAILLAAFVVGLLSPSGALAGTLDQQQTIGTSNVGIVSTQSLAQTFTAGRSGQLDQVDLDLVKHSSPVGLSVELRNVVAAAPGTQVLASASVPAASVSGVAFGFIPVVFATAPPVTAGTQYAIVAYTASVSPNSYSWADGNGNPYSGGTELSALSSPPVPPWSSFATYDFAFKTYVAPTPPPATGQQAAALSRCKKKFKKNHNKKKRKRCKKKAKRLPV